MTDLRQAAQQALEALVQLDGLDTETECVTIDVGDVIAALRTALEQQAEPVSQAVIAGALFDFMGWLTTRKESLVLSSTDNASPAVESITEFAKMRGLSLDDAKVQDWQNYTTQQQAEPPQRPWVGLEAEDLAQIENDEFWQTGNHMAIAVAVEAKLKERNT